MHVPPKKSAKKVAAKKTVAPAKKAATPAKSVKPVKKAAPVKVAKPKAADTAPAAQSFVDVLSNMNGVDLYTFLKEMHERLGQVLASVTGDEVAAAPKPVLTEEEARRQELEELTDRQLRSALKNKDVYEDDDVKNASRDELIAALLEIEFGSDEDDEDGEEESEDEDADESEDDEEADDEDEEEDDGDEDDGDEDDGYTRDELIALKLSELKNLAVQMEIVEDKKELKGWDNDQIADAIIAAQNGEESDDEEEDDDEDGDVYYTEEEYREMNIEQLKAIADSSGIPYRKNVKQDKLIDILVNWEGDDEEE